MSYVAKSVMRQAKNITKGYSEVQAKVREATSNDPWPAPGALMSEIADATNNRNQFLEVMEMVDKRLNDHGKNWRHVLKALTLLDYLIHCGSEDVIQYTRESLYVIKTLKEFRFIDEEGNDKLEIILVRQKSSEITALLQDNARLREQRKNRLEMRNRLNQSSNPYGSGDRDRSSSYYDTRSNDREERELQLAIEESKRTAEEYEKKKKDEERKQRSASVAKAPETNLLDFNDPPQTVRQTQNADPFAIQGHQNQAFNNFNANPFQGAGVSDPFGGSFAPSNNAASFNQANDPFGLSNNSNNNFATVSNPLARDPFSSMGSDPFAPQSNNAFAFPGSNQGNFPQNQSIVQLKGTSNFNAGFNQTAQPSRMLYPMSGNANAQLAEIARNANTIDPFASLASNRNGAQASSVQSNADPLGRMVELNPESLSNHWNNPQISNKNPFAQTANPQQLKTMNELAMNQNNAPYGQPSSQGNIDIWAKNQWK